MIARIWTGVVGTSHLERYVDYIESTGVGQYRRTPGCVLASTLTRDLGAERSEVVAFSVWQDRTHIQSFTGPDIDTMVLYPQDATYLLEPPTLVHQDVRSYTATREEPTTMSTNEDIARAFSGHQFETAFPHLAPDITWTLVGQGRVDGSDAVKATCRDSAAEAPQASTRWLRFISTGDGDVIAIDAIGSYDGPNGISVVSSCDIYEFLDGTIRTITSYAADIEPRDPIDAAIPAP